MGFDYELGRGGGGDGVSEVGGGVDEGGGREGVAEGEGGFGEDTGWEELLGGDWKLAGGRAGDLNGRDDVIAWCWRTVSMMVSKWLYCLRLHPCSGGDHSPAN